MSTEAAILRGKGLISNPAFFLIFTVAAVMGIAGTSTVGLSWLDYSDEGMFEGIRFGAIGLVATIGILFAVAWFSGLGEKLFVGVVALAGLAGGLTSATVVFYLWGPVHGEYIWASLLALLLVTMPVAAIAGEKVLPLFVAFIAGVWGVISIIVLTMVLFQLGLE